MNDLNNHKESIYIGSCVCCGTQQTVVASKRRKPKCCKCKGIVFHIIQYVKPSGQTRIIPNGNVGNTSN